MNLLTLLSFGFSDSSHITIMGFRMHPLIGLAFIGIVIWAISKRGRRSPDK
jgi:hypothetical protein